MVFWAVFEMFPVRFLLGFVFAFVGFLLMIIGLADCCFCAFLCVSPMRSYVWFGRSWGPVLSACIWLRNSSEFLYLCLVGPTVTAA